MHCSYSAQEDLEPLFEFLAGDDLSFAIGAREAIARAYELLRFTPFACWKTQLKFIRKIAMPFDLAGQVMLL